jgi:DedD protein
MGFLSSIFKRRDPTPAPVSDEALVARVRTSARRRLVGAVVLLGIGVVAFPLIFETQPRPIPVDIPIEIPRKEGQPPLALPAPKPMTPAASKPQAQAADAKAEAPRDPVPAAKIEAKPEPKPEPKAESRPEAKPEAKPAAVAKPADAASKPLDEGAGRFVVQVGAFAEAGAVREARTKVEKLGLATYTQVIETPSGKRTRVRVGPFASREEADKAAARLKAAGLPGAVLTL